MAEKLEKPSAGTKLTAADLAAQMALHRAEMGQGALLLREDLNVRAKVRHAVQESPRVWMGAVTATGLVVGVAVPKLALLVGKALALGKKEDVEQEKDKRRFGRSSKAAKEQSEKAATKGAAMGTLMGTFGSLLIGILRPIIIRAAQDQIQSRFLGRGGAQYQSQSKSQMP